MPQPNPYQPQPEVRLTHPEWSKNATIYQINTRQFTPEGTFRAADNHAFGKTLRGCVSEAGFSALEILPIENDFLRFYRLNG